jgi:WD40 repeat protein
MAGTSEPVRPVAPSEIATREEFAAVLTALRTRAGLSIRGLALALGTPTATVGDYCSGRHLPGPGQRELFTAMLRLLGVEGSQIEGWLEVVARLRAGSDGRMRRAAVPYQGLMPFDVDDRDRFFGREALTAAVLQRLREQAAGRAAKGLVLVVGPSGAGKSSLVRAGVEAEILAGALNDQERAWSVRVFSPGERPLESLLSELGELPQAHRVLIVDQLEEIFATAAGVQDRFLEELEHAAANGALVIGALRADFYEQAVRSPVLLSALRSEPVLLGPLSAAELRSTILGPARHAGVKVDEGLVELLISDLAPRDVSGVAHDVGSLPLLSHALLQSWERASGNRLTIADYRAAGGLHGAVSQTAEEVFTELTVPQQSLARRVFMRLARVPDDGPAVRRRAPRHELDALSESKNPDLAVDAADTDEIVDRFVAARLLTVDTETVELSHDALLTAWPRLAGWVGDNRDGLRLHRQLTDTANEWVAMNRDQALLLRGARLQLIEEWARDPGNRSELNADERAFLTKSQELTLQKRKAARRRARQMRLLATVSLLLAAAAIVLAAVALHASQTATRARNDALSRQIALQASAVTPTDPSLAMQLAVLAHKISPTTDATSALLDASDGELPTRLTGPTGPAFLSSATSDGRIAVAYSAVNQVRIYALNRTVPRLLSSVSTGPTSAQTFAVALSPDGQLLATGGTTHEITVWDLASPTHPKKLTTLRLPAGTVYAVEFSPDGDRLAAVNATRNVEVWSVSDNELRPIAKLSGPAAAQLHAVQFAPNSTGLAAAGINGEVLVWRRTAAETSPVAMTVAGAPTMNAVAFSPDGKMIAAGGTDDLVHRWRLPTSGSPEGIAPLRGFTSWVESLAFSANGQDLAAGSSDATVRIWPTDGSAAPPTVLAHPAAVTGVAFATDESQLFSVDSAGTVRRWTIPAPSARLAPGKVFGLYYNSSGRRLAVISSGPKGDAAIWHTSSTGVPSLIANVPSSRPFGAVAGAGALTEDGNVLAIANADAHVELLDVSNPHHPRTLGAVLTGASPYIEQMAFNSSGSLLAAGDDAGHVNLWDTSDPSHAVAEPTLNRGAAPQIMLGVAFSPDGKLLASASTDGKVRLWNVSSPAHAKLLDTLSGFNGYAYAVAFTPDSKTLVAGGADRTVRLWDVARPAHPTPLGRPLTGPTSSIYDVAVNSAGSRLAAATTNGYVWLWNISKPSRPLAVASLVGSNSDLYAVNFQPHSNGLVAGGTDQELHVWDDDPTSAATEICRIGGTRLSQAEWSEYVESGKYDPPCQSGTKH